MKTKNKSNKKINYQNKPRVKMIKKPEETTAEAATDTTKQDELLPSAAEPVSTEPVETDIETPAPQEQQAPPVVEAPRAPLTTELPEELKAETNKLIEELTRVPGAEMPPPPPPPAAPAMPEPEPVPPPAPQPEPVAQPAPPSIAEMYESMQKLIAQNKVPEPKPKPAPDKGLNLWIVVLIIGVILIIIAGVALFAGRKAKLEAAE